LATSTRAWWLSWTYLANLPSWKAWSAAGYPDPIVGLPESRARALETYQRLKDG
jgi:hypothetical protein